MLQNYSYLCTSLIRLSFFSRHYSLPYAQQEEKGFKRVPKEVLAKTNRVCAKSTCSNQGLFKNYSSSKDFSIECCLGRLLLCIEF